MKTHLHLASFSLLAALSACTEQVGNPLDPHELHPDCVMTDRGQACFAVTDGIAVASGDIVLGDATKIQALAQAQLAQQAQGEISVDSYWSTAAKRWPNRTIPYVVKEGFSAPGMQQLQDSLDQYNNGTSLRWVPRTTEADYVVFEPTTFCDSPVGRQGGAQLVHLDANGACPAAHEMGHVAGMYHEHQRPDRDDHITVFTNTEVPGTEKFFIAEDVGLTNKPYDVHSIMHWGSLKYAQKGNRSLVMHSGASIKETWTLSDEDRAWVDYYYPAYTASPAPAACGRIDAGKGIPTATSVASCNGQYHLTMQDNGELVLDHSGNVLFDTRTSDRAGFSAEMQADGNFVLYNGNHEALWASNTDGHPGAYAAVQDDGNLVVYAAGGQPLWATGTNGK